MGYPYWECADASGAASRAARESKHSIGQGETEDAVQCPSPAPPTILFDGVGGLSGGSQYDSWGIIIETSKETCWHHSWEEGLVSFGPDTG